MSSITSLWTSYLSSGLQIPVGTAEASRTTVPFLYNLDKHVEGLDVVDFPGVDDEDDTIPDIADLLVTVAQIVIFVVDYRYCMLMSISMHART